MKERKKCPEVLMIMLCVHCSLGGAEKRYGRVFEQLASEPESPHHLLINRTMLEILQSAGILKDAAGVIILDPPLDITGRTVLRPLVRPLLVLWYAVQCWLAIGRLRPDVVHPLLGGILFAFPALVGHPHVACLTSAYTSYRSPFAASIDHHILGVNLRGAVRRLAVQRCSTVDALSFSIRDQLVEAGLDERSIFVAPCSFTDVSRCYLAPRKERSVVFLGRMIEAKQPDVLVRAIPMVLAHHPDVHFYLLGEGPLRPHLETFVSEMGLGDSVTIRFEPQPIRFLSRSSIFVSLQTHENYPSQALLEAMACGNAVVATDVGETWRLVDEKVGRRVAPTGEKVAAAIIALLDTPRRLHTMQVAARQRVLSDHSADRFMAYLYSVYEAAFQRRSR